MKKRQITIESLFNESGVYTIVINNARFHKNFVVWAEKIIKQFAGDQEVFFGFYRTDGMNLTLERQRELRDVIPSLFKKYGDIEGLSDYLTIARIQLNNSCYGLLPSVFDYFLETMLFIPKVEWETFRQYHLNYQEYRFEEIILHDLADLLFCYFDSGDFMICLNPQVYSHETIRGMAVEAFGRG